MILKRWALAPLDRGRAAALAQRHSLPSYLALLMEVRGQHTDQQVAALMGPGSDFSDPFLMKDMDKAVRRIRRAVDQFEPIVVYGDYDADGVTSTAMVYSYLQAMGADVTYYIPQRAGEGYGMNPASVEALARRGVKLIITVDNGISAVEEVALAKSLGMDVVVTDHHQPHEKLPQAAAVVDAHRPDDTSPFKEFSGAGVALKLLMALEEDDPEGVVEEYVDLAALGTVADVMALTGENRTLVRRGLRSIMRGARLGVNALMEDENLTRPVTANRLSFFAIPRINAAGRMGVPERAVRLLCSEDEEEVRELAAEILEDNERRRQMENTIVEEVISAVEADPTLQYSRIIVVAGEGWHPGIIGLAAGKIAERYGRPCMVLSIDGETAKGSGRSVEGFPLFDALCACARLLDHFGGHPMAAGVTIRREFIDEFRRTLNAYAAAHFPEMPAPVVHLDARLNPAVVSPDIPRQLQALEPFGAGNPAPLFGLFGMKIRELSPMGGGRHLKLSVQKKGASVVCKCFGTAPEDFPFSVGDTVDLAVQAELNEWHGREELNFIVREVRLSGLSDEECIHSCRVYEKFRRGEALTPAEAETLTPNRRELAAVYRLLRDMGGRWCSHQSLLGRLGEPGAQLGKLAVRLDILEERGLVEFTLRRELLQARVPKQEGKVDIFASSVLERLRAQTARNGPAETGRS